MSMYCGLRMKINMCEMQHSARRWWTHFVCVSFRQCGQQKPAYLCNWRSMADDAITWHGIGVLGSPFYICGLNIHAYGNVCACKIWCDWEHTWSSGKVQDSWSLDHQNVVSSSPATASMFVSLGKILNLNLLRWPERIWYLSTVGNITI